MDIKKILAICITAIAINTISVMSITCVEAASQDPVSAPQVSSTIHIGMPKEDLFKIYHRSDIKKFERRDNEEVFVFDDILTSDPDDTITFYLVDGKVKEYDKNIVIFPTDEGLRSVIHPNISKEDLLKIYPIGNLKLYTKNGNKEVGTFYDILTSDPDSTITFYLVDGKVKSWRRNKVIFPTKEDLHKIFPIGNLKAHARSDNVEAETFYNILTSDPNDTITFYLVDGKVSSWALDTEASAADVKLLAESVADVKLKTKADADARSKANADARFKAEADADARSNARSEADARSKAKAEADFKEILLRAKSDADARIKAMEERSRHDNYSQSHPTAEDDIIKSKQQNRASSIRSNNWNYNGGLYYR